MPPACFRKKQQICIIQEKTAGFRRRVFATFGVLVSCCKGGSNCRIILRAAFFHGLASLMGLDRLYPLHCMLLFSTRASRSIS